MEADGSEGDRPPGGVARGLSEVVAFKPSL